MSRMMKMFKTLREENESVVKLKGIYADGKLPKGLLLEGKKALESELVDRSGVFQNAKKLDAMNEAMPITGNGSGNSGSGSSLQVSKNSTASNSPSNQT